MYSNSRCLELCLSLGRGQDEDSDEEKGPDDKDDGEFDPSEDAHAADDDDVDFHVEEIRSPWSKRQRTPATKKPVISASS